LVFESGPEHTDFAVFELFNPRYDEETSRATYDVRLLEEWERTLGMSFTKQEANLTQVHPEFGTAHLFIDGCADRPIYCYMPGNPTYVTASWLPQPFCFHDGYGCYPCPLDGESTVPEDIVNDWLQSCESAVPECVSFGCYIGWDTNL